MRQGGRIVRHVIFAVVLVGASFLGGAFVNGPGLKWLQVKVLGHAGLNGEVPSLTLPAAVASGSDGDSAPSEDPLAVEQPASKIKELPSPKEVAAGAPRPEPVPDPEPVVAGKSGLSNVLGSLLSLGDTAAAGQSASSPKSPKSAKVTQKKPVSAEPSKPPAIAQRAKTGGLAPVGDVPELPAMPAPEPRDAGPPAPLDPSVTPALLASLTSPSSGSGSPEAKVPVTQASATSEPRPLPLPLPSPSPSSASFGDDAAGRSSTDPEPAAGADEWGTIRRKLKTMGVTHYTIEGEPGGRVSFSCLIPLAGRQAVSQRFQAEGGDEIQAARTALRRIGLWQATERDRPAR
jgi:hypothetical protein